MFLTPFLIPKILIKEKSGAFLATSWFKVADLETYLRKRYGDNRTSESVDDIWLDLEPSGQINFKVNFGRFFVFLLKYLSDTQEKHCI